MCTWNRTRFKNGVRRFFNLKKCDRTKTEAFKFGNNLAQPEPKEPSPFFKFQNRTGGSLKKEEPHNSGHYLLTTQNSLFLGIFWGKEMFPNFHLHFILFLGPPNFLIIVSSFFRLTNFLILFYSWLYNFPLFWPPNFPLFVWLSNFVSFISCFQISLVFFFSLLPNFLFFIKKKTRFICSNY